MNLIRYQPCRYPVDTPSQPRSDVMADSRTPFNRKGPTTKPCKPCPRSLAAPSLALSAVALASTFPDCSHFRLGPSATDLQNHRFPRQSVCQRDQGLRRPYQLDRTTRFTPGWGNLAPGSTDKPGYQIVGEAGMGDVAVVSLCIKGRVRLLQDHCSSEPNLLSVL